VKVALLTGGKDAHYMLGLLGELAARGIEVALVGDDELADAEDTQRGRVKLHNLVGGLDSEDGLLAKVWRVASYYARLVAFAARTDGKLFHILWFRKFPLAERLP
jgi:muconolactone delta-isomerase